MRIGIIGTGAMGGNHLRVVNALPELELCCASDIDKKNLDTACEPYESIGLKKYTNHQEMLDHVDGVMVSTPTIFHYEIARFFLENGKHVLMEKPIANSLEEADHLIQLAEKNGVTLAVGHLERFNPAVEYIKPIVTKPLFIEVQRLGSFSPRSLDVDVIMDLMIHDLDIILQYDNSGIKRIDAAGVPIVTGKIDIANVRLQFNSGLVANVTASRVSQKRTRKLRIFQKNHYISLDYKQKRVKMFALSHGNIVEDVPQIEDVEPLKNLWSNFFKTISMGKNHNVTGKDGRDALALAISISDAIKKSMEDM